MKMPSTRDKTEAVDLTKTIIKNSRRIYKKVEHNEDLRSSCSRFKFKTSLKENLVAYCEISDVSHKKTKQETSSFYNGRRKNCKIKIAVSLKEGKIPKVWKNAVLIKYNT